MSLKKSEYLKRFYLVDHFNELRAVILKTIGFFFVVFFCTLAISRDVFNFLAKPLIIESSRDIGFMYTKLTEAFFVELKISLILSIFCTLPFLLYQVYRFISPGLYSYERKSVMVYMLFSPVLFVVGILFVYFLIMPITWKFFLSFENFDNGVKVYLEPRMTEYVDLIIELIIGCGIGFQLPIILIILTKFGITSVANLVKFRRYSIVLIFIAAAILTPPDVISQIMLALPLILLYEISILLCSRVKNRKNLCMK